jgi:peptide/nickel transport system substrate-binding protein
VKLRAGLRWEDGRPVTAEDVKFSYERIAGSDSAWAYQFEKFDHVEVIDARSGIIHLKQPFKPFWIITLPYYGGHIVCKAAVEKVGGSYTTEIPAQCGPFLMEKWEQNQKVTLTANPDWPGPKSDFSKIEIYIVVDDQAAQLAYEADAFDFTKLAVSAAKQVKANMPKGAKLIETQSTRYAWLTINMNSPLLSDIRVRQAIQYAYDSDAVLQGVARESGGVEECVHRGRLVRSGARAGFKPCGRRR